jgi:hypothetical protein
MPRKTLKRRIINFFTRKRSKSNENSPKRSVLTSILRKNRKSKSKSPKAISQHIVSKSPVKTNVDVSKKLDLDEIKIEEPDFKTELMDVITKHNPFDIAGIEDKFDFGRGRKEYVLKCIVTSFLFQTTLIDTYMSEIVNNASSTNLRHTEYKKLKLLNRDDLTNAMFYKPGIVGNRFQEQIGSSPDNEIIKPNVKLLSEHIVQNFCSTDVNEDYIEETVFDVFDLNTNADYDMLFICGEQFLEPTLDFENRLPHIKAFIVMQKGECKTLPNSYSIRLLCSRLDSKSVGYGSLLLGAVLYCNLNTYRPKSTQNTYNSNSSNGYYNIRMEDVPSVTIKTFDEPYADNIIVLEALNGYVNPAAICTYEKFGFVYNKILIDTNCFSSSDNTPMIFDPNNFISKSKNTKVIMDEYKKLQSQIVDTVLAKRSGFTQNALCKIKGKKQELLGYLNNFIFKEEYDKSGLGIKSEYNDIEIQMIKIISDLTTKSDNNNELKKVYNQLIEHIISDNNDPEMSKVVSKLLDLLPDKFVKPVLVATSSNQNLSRSNSRRLTTSKSKNENT